MKHKGLWLVEEEIPVERKTYSKDKQILALKDFCEAAFHISSQHFTVHGNLFRKSQEVENYDSLCLSTNNHFSSKKRPNIIWKTISQLFSFLWMILCLIITFRNVIPLLDNERTSKLCLIYLWNKKNWKA